MENLSTKTPKGSLPKMPKMASKLRKWSILLCSMVVLIASCTGKKPPAASGETAQQQAEAAPEGGKTLIALRERGVLKVGFSSFNPWAMQDVNGEWIGFEMDVARALSQYLGLKLELVPTAWAGIIPALLTNKFDVIIAGMSVTEERAEQVTFSIPYEYNKTVLLLNQNVSASSLEELNQTQFRFVGRAGSTPFNLTLELLPEAQHKSFDDDGLALQDLVNGQADGYLTTSVEAALHLEDNPGAIYAPDWSKELKKEDAAFAFPKNAEAAWVEYINQWIEQNWENGFLEERSAYWFESRDWTKDHQLAE